MNRGLFNLIIDLLAATCLLVMVGTGYVLQFPLPPATDRTHELWGMSRHEWGKIHSSASLGLLAILLVHVVLHWEWIVSMVRRRFVSAPGVRPVRPLRAGVISGATIVAGVGLFAWVTHLGVRKRKVPLHPLYESRESGGARRPTHSSRAEWNSGGM